MARRTRSADLRKHLRSGLETVGGPDEDDPQRVSSASVAERSAGHDWTPYGGIPLRQRDFSAPGLRARKKIGARARVHGERRRRYLLRPSPWTLHTLFHGD